jgi:hypothetical protein
LNVIPKWNFRELREFIRAVGADQLGDVPEDKKWEDAARERLAFGLCGTKSQIAKLDITRP